jgi:NO-binding membrane sensor protein with MHYT domain
MDGIVNVEYSYDIYNIGTAVLSGMVGTYTTMNIIQNIRYCDTFKLSILFIIISSISLAALSVWTTHFLMLNSMIFEITIYIKISYTILSLIFSIVCNMIGFWISFMPFLNRVREDFKQKLTNNRFLQNKNKESQKFITSSEPLPSNSKLNEISRNVMIINNPVQRDQLKKMTTKNDITDLDFTLAFNQTKFIRKDYIYMLIGGLFLGPSIMVLHFVGMLAMQIKGDIKVSHALQTPITIAGILASFVINLAFFGPNSNFIKIFLSVLITGTVMALHCLSIHISVFSFNNNEDYSFIDTDNNLITLALGGKIIVVIASTLSYLFREITNAKIRKSLRIVHDISDYVKGDEFNYDYVKKYLEFIKFEKKEEEKKPTEISLPVTKLKLNINEGVYKLDMFKY